jgi:hypothetical protein
MAAIDRARAVAITQTRLRLGARSRVSFSPQKPTDRQELFLGLPHKEAFYGGAAGGGKSSALLMAALQHVDVSRYSALILRRTFADLSKPGALLDRAREWLSQSSARYNDQRHQWRFPSGAVLAFGYLENDADVYQYQSSEFQFIAFDELTQFSKFQYTYLFSRLRRLADSTVPLRMRSASNPGGIGAEWVYERFIPHDWQPDDAADLQVHEKDGRAFVPARLEDNPHLDQESYDESLEELDEVTRAQLRSGDWRIRKKGNIYKSWTDGPDSHYVITWSQFAEVFKERAIPSDWLGACGQDWGFDPDPAATVWNFVAAENSPKVDGIPLAGSIFAPQILTCKGEIPDHVGEKIKLIEAEHGWASRIQYRVMSHEASSQQATYRVKCGLMFSKWEPDAHGGIAQMQHALKLRHTDDQVINPKGDEGLALLRAEFREYKYIEQVVTERKGSNRIVPFGHFNHYMDAQRGIAARWFPAAKAMSYHEKVEDAIPEGRKYEDLREQAPLGDGLTPEAELLYVIERQRAMKKVKPAIQRFDEFGRLIS